MVAGKPFQADKLDRLYPCDSVVTDDRAAYTRSSATDMVCVLCAVKACQ